MSKIGVLLADDHTIFRQGLKALLSAEPDITVVGEAATGNDALELARDLRPSIVIMDITMPEMNGLQAAARIHECDPSIGLIILSMSDDVECVTHAIQAGVRGYLVKQTASSELIFAIREIKKGNAYFSPTVSKAILQIRGATPLEPVLTLREREILQCISIGQTNSQISSTLCLSTKTIEKYRQQIMNKLDLHDAITLTRYAILKGIVK